jgi:phosphomannomutase/phosphoglucomutase
MAKINPSIYRAYDIRGKYPSDLDVLAAEKVARSLSELFFKKGPVVVAHDARMSSPALYEAVIRGLKDRKIISVGPSTTPMFYFFVTVRSAAGGIMVTASHQPAEWNGLKPVGPRAYPINGFDIKKMMDKNG